MKNLINILVACMLVAAGVFVFLFIPTAVDFNNVIIRLEDNDKIYSFLIYLPIILSFFSALLAVINVVLRNMTLTVMNFLISLGIIIFISVDYMGFLNAVPAIGEKLRLVQYANIGACVLLVVECIIFIVSKVKAKKTA